MKTAIPSDLPMNSISSLSVSHQQTYDEIYRHPAVHTLKWHDVYALFEQLGQVNEEANGHLKFTRNGQIRVFPPRSRETVDVEELMELRHFLDRSALPPSATAETNAPWLLVIDHHEARIYRSEAPRSSSWQFLPHRPEDHFRHTHNSKDFSRGREKPDPNSFFTPIAKALQGTSGILVMGGGKGMSSEMEQFTTWLHQHHPELGNRVIGSLVVDQHHLTESQLLAKAREFCAASSINP